MTDNLSFLSEFRKLKILIAPLNWGLGHASRILPIIDLLSEENDIIIASDGIALHWLKNEKPELDFVALPSYNIQYAKGPMWFNMMRQGPHILKTIYAEKNLIKDLVVQHSINMVISDHRLGLNSTQAKSIFLGHQIKIPHSNRIVSKIATQIQLSFINKFDEIWVPDFPYRNKLSGVLSKTSTKPGKRYIGPLSRLQYNNPKLAKYDIAVILSGPEPARMILEKALFDILMKLQQFSVVIVRGTKTEAAFSYSDDQSNIETIDLASTKEIQDILSQSSLVICRAGYSSIMDLYCLQKNAILIPTPNQPEQEYLAKINSGRKQFYWLDQSELSTSTVEKAMNYFSIPSK